MQKKEIGIGILGLGTIGSGVLSLLEENRSFIEQEIFPHKIKVIGLADLDAGRKPKPPVNYQFFTDQAQEVVEHPEIQIEGEAIGGRIPGL